MRRTQIYEHHNRDHLIDGIITRAFKFLSPPPPSLKIGPKNQGPKCFFSKISKFTFFACVLLRLSDENLKDLQINYLKRS